jgi:hypothetical protein
MPKLMGQSDTTVLQTVSNFGFTAQRPETLGASEYTLVGIATDVSGSVSPFKADLEKAYRDIIGSCRKNPRAENLLVRGTKFNDSLSEEHGFQGLDNIDENKVSFRPGGGTALFDSALEGIEALGTYGKQLADMDYLVNAVLFIVTDGDDNASRVGNPSKVKAALDKIKRSESLESIKVILIGVGDQGYVQGYLDTFHKDAGLDQFVWIGNADAKSLAKLADFVSRSISSSSQALGTGGPSQNLTV